jgi:hypothetical protein
MIIVFVSAAFIVCRLLGAMVIARIATILQKTAARVDFG